jgi:hypothetical protein
MNQILLIIILGLFSTVTVGAQNIYMKHNEKGFWIYEGKDKVMFFQRHPNDSIPGMNRSNYFHPVYDLNGNCITEDFPQDHLHHRGIFWAWLQIIVKNENIADTWHLRNFIQEIDQVEFKTNTSGNGELEYSSFWYTKNNTEIPFMLEKTKVKVYQRTRNYRQIDFQIELRALQYELQIGGSPDEKGYGGFSIRMKTDENTFFSGLDNQIIDPQNTAIQAGHYVSISNPHQKSGVSIISHLKNPGTPAWILRQTGSMQNCAWPGSEPVPVSINEPVLLQYSVIIHKGKPKQVPFEKILLKKIKTPKDY